MAHTIVSDPTRKRILQTCVRLFLSQGYEKTTMTQMLQEARVSNSSYQNLFRAKDGVLVDLTQFMFSNQFSAAKEATANQPPVCVYASETAIQLTLTELDENLREIYVLSYSKPELLELIVQATAKEMQAIFSPYLPECGEQDFYDLDVGSCGIMRNFMARPCDEEFTLEKKLRFFLSLSLRAYNVPQAEVDQAIAFINSLDIRALAQQSLDALLESLQMHYDFKLPEASATEA